MVSVDVEKVLQNVQGNLSLLMHRILMVRVEDLLEAMQRHVVGVPHACVRLFRHLMNAIVFYHETHLRHRAYIPWLWDVSIVYVFFRVTSPILYYDIICFGLNG
jgi:hypothetical protein